MYPGGSSFQNEITSNIPNMSLMFTMYTTTFGNQSFMVQPASPGEVQAGFPSVPYLSLEALLYQGQSSNPQTSPTNVMTGSSSGTQNTSGTQTVTDSTGNVRVAIGNLSNSTANIASNSNSGTTPPA
jgi:hypothetical protein